MFGLQTLEARNSGLQRWNMTAPHTTHCSTLCQCHACSKFENHYDSALILFLQVTFTLKTGFPTLALVLQGAGKVHKVHQELVGAGAGVRLGQSLDWVTALSFLRPLAQGDVGRCRGRHETQGHRSSREIITSRGARHRCDFCNLLSVSRLLSGETSRACLSVTGWLAVCHLHHGREAGAHEGAVTDDASFLIC